TIVRKLKWGQEDFLKWFRRYIEELKAANDPRCTDDIELIFRWDRTSNTDKEMLMHMSSMHRTWRGVLKKRERMIQLSTPSLDSESGSTPISAEEAFVSVMGKNRSGRIRCGGSRETRRTWYGTGEGSSSTITSRIFSDHRGSVFSRFGGRCVAHAAYRWFGLWRRCVRLVPPAAESS
ncbi:hypothetical protein Taro_014869, partial [Colocasia esculenta]|nr:hypothetical protein [Colocasia esculenta]